MTRDIKEILKTYWGYDDFRSLQEEIIRSVLDGKDTLALMPTGRGKVAHVPGVRASDGGRLSGGDALDCPDEGSGGGFEEQGDSGRGDLHGDEA